MNKNCKLCIALPTLNDTGYDWESEDYSVGDMEKMIEISTINCDINDFENTLHCNECKFGKLKKEFMKILIKNNNIDINKYHIGNINECFPKQLKCLVELGFNINKKLDFNNTYLIYLVRGSKNIEKFENPDTFIEKVNILIDAGIDVCTQNNSGETALLELLYYCKNGEYVYELAKLLLEKGADKNINITNKKRRYNTDYNRALNRALHSNKYENVVEIIKLFVDYGLKPMENKENINYGYYRNNEAIRKQIEDVLFPPENGEKIREIIASFKSFVEIAKENIANAENKIAELEAIIATIH